MTHCSSADEDTIESEALQTVVIIRSLSTKIKMKTAVLSIAALAIPATSALSVTVFGGTGYVGSAVCERLIKKGHTVTAVSRRGQNPKPDNAELSQVGPRRSSFVVRNITFSRLPIFAHAPGELGRWRRHRSENCR